jgi:hypothetical protein
MRRAALAMLLPCCLGAFALVAGGAACDSTLNLSNPADAAGDSRPQDSAPLTCDGICDRLIFTCSLFPIDRRAECMAECNREGSLAELTCVAQTACADIVKTCGDGRTLVDGSGPDGSVINDFEIKTCQSACDSSQFFGCIDAAQLSECRALCASAPAAKRNAYDACASGAGGDCPSSRDCFDLFTKD